MNLINLNEKTNKKKKICKVCSHKEHKNMRTLSQTIVGGPQMQKLQVSQFYEANTFNPLVCQN